jgi:RES domain-containing protein
MATRWPIDELEDLPGHNIRRRQQIAVGILLDETGEVTVTPVPPHARPRQTAPAMRENFFPPGLGAIYASRSYTGAMLECLAQADIGRVLRTHLAVGIAIAEADAAERHDESSLPAGWDHADLRVARAFGDAWIRARRTAVLVVPSVVARREGKVLIDPKHPDFSRIVAGRPEPVVWDARLVGRH